MSEITNYKQPTLAEIFEESSLNNYAVESLNYILNQPPKASWVKVHPFIKDHKYLPINIVEWLLKKIFKKYSIEIRSQGQTFNGVYVVVRVHYWNPTTDTMDFHDGIGACSLQTKSGSSPAELQNINNGALSMAFPIAKTLAIKDACDHLGSLFGADLNRKDLIPFQIDENLSKSKLDPIVLDQWKGELKSITTLVDFSTYKKRNAPKDKEIIALFNERENELKIKLS